MVRRMRALWATGLALSLMAGSVGLAAQPAWAHDQGDVGDQSQMQDTVTGQDQGQAQGQGQGQAQAQSSQNGPGSADQGQGHHFGDTVAAAVYAAREQGDTGTVLADAVHQILLTEHPNAKGLAVAEAVYAGTQSSGQGGSPFADVEQQAPWAAAAVGALQQAGVVNGTSATTFDPNAEVTLGELATMLARLQAAPAASASDAGSGTPAWAQNGLAWAQEAGVLAGEQGLGDSSTALTRAQAVLMLINAAGLGRDAAADAGAPIDLQGTPPTWAQGALALAIQLGLLQGSGGQLLANQPLTRAQMAVLLARLAVLLTQAGGN